MAVYAQLLVDAKMMARTTARLRCLLDGLQLSGTSSRNEFLTTNRQFTGLVASVSLLERGAGEANSFAASTGEGGAGPAWVSG